ncbi:AbrB family transcriptional regulator [Thermoplasmatales archaeon ex4572_165]|nr:MAG: AbrB family transcriptional regulator [Thermoplasmatales archaeon ex4572_165]RLF59218.1 MAG: AbrB/MazE/SpoVT family DNA-binding domain-containing protein [Thermoplasmata archaeon]
MPHKQKRKLIKIGETSLAIIIPKAWLRYYKLDYGDDLDIISNGNIIIQKSKEDKIGHSK